MASKTTKTAENEAVQNTQDKKKQAIDRMNELVPIKLFKDNQKYKDDLTVTVNGVTYQIQRGVPVEVPRFVADVITQSERQDQHTANMIEKLTDDFRRKTEAIK